MVNWFMKCVKFKFDGEKNLKFIFIFKIIDFFIFENNLWFVIYGL